MARGRRQGQQPQLKGFRPGKAPPELRKRAAKQQMGEMNAAQEKLVDLFAGKSPEASRKLIARWLTWTLVGAILLTLLSLLAWSWSWIAGVPVSLLAGGLFFVHIRLRRQRSQLEEVADQVARIT